MGIVGNMSVRLTDIRDSMEICNRWISEEVAKLLSSVDLIILPYIEASDQSDSSCFCIRGNP